MGDWNEIITGRSSVRRARPLILAMNVLRRQEEEMERIPGINPGRGQGSIQGLEIGKGSLGWKMLICSWEEVGHSWHPQKLMPSGNNPIPNPAA